MSTEAKPANVIRIVLTTHFFWTNPPKEHRQARDAHKGDKRGGCQLPGVVASVQPRLV